MKRALLIVLVASLALATGCSAAPPQREGMSPSPAPSVLTELSPREGVTYPESGIYAAEETSVAVGVLRYKAQSDTVGVWLLTSRDETAVLAAEAEPFAILSGSSGFDSELWPLDGQYVAVEGSIIARDSSVAEMKVKALSRVADIFRQETNVFSKPGVYTMWDGSAFVMGWAGATVDGTTDVYDLDPDGSETPTLIAQVALSGMGVPRGQVLNAGGLMVRDEPVQLVRAPLGGAYGPGPIMPIEVGRSVGWRTAEQPGIKDLIGGRHRAVGILRRETDPDSGREEYYLGELSVPFLRTVQGWRVRLDDPEGLVDPDALLANETYVAVEGSLSADSSLIRVETLEVVPVR